MVFTILMECVYCSVRPESSVYFSFFFFSRVHPVVLNIHRQHNLQLCWRCIFNIIVYFRLFFIFERFILTLDEDNLYWRPVLIFFLQNESFVSFREVNFLGFFSSEGQLLSAEICKKRRGKLIDEYNVYNNVKHKLRNSL